MKTYDVIVIGGGHAGIEAALASARMGNDTLMLILNAATIGVMSCNPAIGGVGKGQLVKEIDALGGAMGRAADACGIQFRVLNASKGPAVQSSRAQIDMARYARYMRKLVQRQPHLDSMEGHVTQLLVAEGRVEGVLLETGAHVKAKAVVIAAGTFLDGLLHIGLNHHPGGRINEPAAVGLAGYLQALGFTLLRFKTGTCPRLDKNSIDFSQLIEQRGDGVPRPFSFATKGIKRRQVPCYITYTNEATHAIIRENLNRSPLYSGLIKATGVRYCPSIEDKIVKFADKTRHQLFLEPQGLNTDEIYPNGLSTSLPEDVQEQIVHSIKGLEHAKILRFGYGIEHTVVEPTQLFPTLETKRIKNLFCAGQINGTTGYEEAAAQGLLAGINAGLRVKQKEPLILDRASSYLGVLVDDLTTKGTSEPYRMFTSRVEYRLIVREDNADIRLRNIGYALGLVSRKDNDSTNRKITEIKRTIAKFKECRLKPSAKTNELLRRLNTAAIAKVVTLEELLKRPQVGIKDLALFDHGKVLGTPEAMQQVEIEIKYAGFIQRQNVEVERFKHLEKILLSSQFNYTAVPGLSHEIKEKLTRAQPMTLGQASRISGVTPAAIALLMVWLRKGKG
ncbi:MAG: tRNA uridine-5-carboxymethylaminomethyl(34) synthesis enzyme MnmG [Candidatus Omnitrophica bacterium]|nr:tRNA uridine-5-carboxymethylaminomethyl(34) synthesis enzyme MnmG [Candidatus Omnitrophota bacterium]